MSEIKYQKLDTLLKYLPKSKIKAGDGQSEGKYRFFKSGANQSKFIDIAKFEGESLIIGDGGSANINYYNDKFSTSDHCYVIQKQENLDIDMKYVYYFLKTNIHILEAGFKGAGLKNISKKYISNIKIPVQPLENQRKISTFLTQIERLIQKREDSIKLLDELIKSTFLDMFGDPVLNPKKFKVEVLEKYFLNKKEGTKCGPFGSALKKNEYVTQGVPVWNMDNITKQGDFTDIPYLMITEEKFSSLESYFVQNGDIIISRAGTVGKMCVVDSKYEKSLISTNLIRVRLDGNKLLPVYFVKLMVYFKARIKRLETGSDGSLTHMSTKVLKLIEFPYPPKPLQDKFSTILEQVEVTKVHYKKSLEELKNLFNSTAQKAFKGELDVSKIDIEQTQKEEALIMLDKEQVLELIKQGNFDPKDYVNAEQSYDSIRDLIIGKKDKKGLIDDGLVVQNFDDITKKMILEAT